MTLFNTQVRTDAQPGTRLHRFELYNWGTFNHKAWTFDVEGHNALLTGEVGSGKSTIVDALTTLLLAANKISYNKAAGADARERDLRSYVLGYYKSERVEATGATRPLGLRTPQHYSVILGVFTNVDFASTTTIAQVFRAREDNSQPERFFVVADSELTIAKHFSEFGNTLPELKRSLRQHGARIYDHFPEYGRDFRRRLGIATDQALDLFHQAVSMKAVDNLNDFVRSHMLEPFDMSGRIKALIDHFDDLTSAHQAVVRARDQLALLDPLVADLDTYEQHVARITQLDALKQAVPYFFATRRDELLAARELELGAMIAAADAEIEAFERQRHDIDQQRDQLNIDIATHGGERIAALEAQVARLRADLPQRQRRLDEHNAELAALGIDRIDTRDQFVASRAAIADARQRDDTRAGEVAVALRDHEQQRLAVDAEIRQVNAELHSLNGRASNLPRESLEIRDQLCADLELDAADLPFAANW